MYLNINGSNSLEQLAVNMSQELKAQRNDVFQAQYIVTQTVGMNNWLKIKMAENLGIVANCKFLKPNDLVNEIYYRLNTNNKKVLPVESLEWVVFELLGSKNFTNQYRNISDYYFNDDLKRLSLAEKVADLFDQYQIYRREMVEDWNQNRMFFDVNNDWQKYLWMKAKEILGDKIPDKTVIAKHIVQELKRPEQRKKLSNEIPHLHVFGLSILTFYHVHIFYELAKAINITFHLLNPSPGIYWFEDKSEKQIAIWKKKSNNKRLKIALQSGGNPLLTGWGKVLQETFSIFFENDSFLNRYNDLDPREPGTETLLGKIQNDIFHNNDITNRNEIREEHLKDGSITINACYTIAREIEVLYNYLVSLVDQRAETLSARDIVVMVTDIDAYAPYIKAVFNSAPHKFPFTIADESFTTTDNLFTALQSVLNLNAENFKAEEVLQLLDSEHIKKRFAITDVEIIRRAVGMANIRFGIDGRNDDDTIYVSWKNGIRRIIYGLCMSGEDQYMVDGYWTYPLDIAEGDASFELIRFCHFVEVLIASIEDRKKVRTLTEWGEYIEQVVEALIWQPEENTDEDYRKLLQNLEKLYLLNDVMVDKISFDVFKHSFGNSLMSEARSAAFATGGITFCSLIPMRSIPFKVVAVLGLNFDKFPRKEARVSFNLMQKEKRKGDRDVKANDKHLFLETILSARKYFYISYIGRSSKDNTMLPPSIVVDELVDYIQSGLGDQNVKAGQLLIRVHPLHSFSPRYVQGEPGLYNYLQLSATNDLMVAPNKLEMQETSASVELSLEALIRFFKNPFKAYYNNILQIRYEHDNILLPEDEVFEPDGLQLWQLKQDLMLLKPEELSSYRNKGVATGSLPLKNMADLVLNDTASGIDDVKQLVEKYMGGAVEQNINTELVVGDTLITGKISRIYDDKLLYLSFSKNECKHLLAAYITFLAAVASGNAVDLYFVSGSKNNVYKVCRNSRSKADALRALKKLVGFYTKGHEEILMFYPGFNKSPAEIAGLTAGGFTRLVDKYLETEYCDRYIKREYTLGYFKRDGIFEQYLQNSAQIFSEASDLFKAYYTS